MALVNKERAMNKFKAYIKRPVNFNLVSMLFIAVLLVGGVILSFYAESWTGSSEFDELGSSINETLSHDEIEDMEGYGLIVESFAYGLGVIGEVFFWVFMIMSSVIISLIIIMLSIISRAVYSAENPKRLLAYRIIAGVCYFFMLASCLLFSVLFFFNPIASVLAAVFDLLVIAVFIIGIRNTYSEKILKGATNEIEI